MALLYLLREVVNKAVNLADRPLLILLLFFGMARFALAAPSLECAQQLLGADISIERSQEIAQTWMKERGKLVETLKNPVSGVERRHAEEWNIQGVPAHAKLIAGDAMVWRHYVPEVSTLEAIRQSKVLIAGFVPYVEIAPGVYRKSFETIHGAFLTLPKATPHDVGLRDRSARYHYVDLKLSREIPVIELEPGNIYVIPLPKNHRPWVRDIYARYKAGESLSADYVRMCEAIDREGGLATSPAAIPIEIMGEGKY